MSRDVRVRRAFLDLKSDILTMLSDLRNEMEVEFDFVKEMGVSTDTMGGLFVNRERLRDVLVDLVSEHSGINKADAENDVEDHLIEMR